MSRPDAHGKRYVEVKNEKGKTVEKFEFNMTNIKTIKGYLQGFWSLNPFSEALTRRNAFSDVDALVEIDGHSLVFEFKRSFFDAKDGQIMTAVRQAKFQKTTTFFIEGGQDNPKYMVIVEEANAEQEPIISGLIPVDKEKIKEYVAEWEKWARKNSLVKGKKVQEWELVKEIKDVFHEVRD